MREIKAIIQPCMLEQVLHALAAIDELPGVTVSQVLGWGQSKAADSAHTAVEENHAFVPMTELEIVVPAGIALRVVDTVVNAARTGRPGDGKVFESDVLRAIRIRTGDEDEAAL